MVRVPKFREPTHPGEMLLEEFLIPMEISQRDLSNAIHVPYQRVNEIINGKRGITPIALQKMLLDCVIGRNARRRTSVTSYSHFSL